MSIELPDGIGTTADVRELEPEISEVQYVATWMVEFDIL